MGFDVPETVWSQCQSQLRNELPEQQYNTWIRPLTVHVPLGSHNDAVVVQLMAPNRFIEDWVKNKFLSRIKQLYADFGGQAISLGVAGTAKHAETQPSHGVTNILARRSNPVRAYFSVDRVAPHDTLFLDDDPAHLQSAD